MSDSKHLRALKRKRVKEIAKILKNTILINGFSYGMKKKVFGTGFPHCRDESILTVTIAPRSVFKKESACLISVSDCDDGLLQITTETTTKGLEIFNSIGFGITYSELLDRGFSP